MKNKFFYRINDFEPGDGWAKFRFSVNLDPKYAKKALEKVIKPETEKRINEIGMSIISDCDLGKSDSPYKFYEGTFLLRNIIVPGNSCELGVDNSEIEFFLRKSKSPDWKSLVDYGLDLKYTPHNIDTVAQAYSLVSLWIKWADILEAQIK